MTISATWFWRCSDGSDRHRQEWDLHGCSANGGKQNSTSKCCRWMSLRVPLLIKVFRSYSVTFRGLQILRWGRDFLLMLSSACAWNSVILEGKRDSNRHSTTGLSEKSVVVETSYQISVRGFIILRSGEGLTSSNKDNSAILGKKYYNETFPVFFFFKVREKTLNQISSSYLFLSSNQKVSINWF